MGEPSTEPANRRLRADCERCFGLCCVAPAFAASADFAIDKPAGQACPNLGDDFRCGIHDRLRTSGFAGCTVYDCFGAGQRVAQVTFAGRSWRERPESAPQMFTVFGVVRELHELLWYLADGRRRDATRTLHLELDRLAAETEALADRSADALEAFDVGEHRRAVDVVLQQSSALVRAGAPGPMAELRGADLMGADRRGRDLRGADLRGSYLIGADLRATDLRLADLIGADLRATDLRGADLTDALHLTNFQLSAAKGDAATLVSPWLDRPAHWST
ncbi:pentapeptide repeat-containing protein [soil metagenome]